MTRSISGHATETMQARYSTVADTEQREAFERVARLTRAAMVLRGELVVTPSSPERERFPLEGMRVRGRMAHSGPPLVERTPPPP